MDSIEMPREKARWELHKNAGSYFEQILEAAPYQTITVWPLTSYITSHPNKMSKTSWRSKNELIINSLQWTHTHGHIRIVQRAETYIHQLCINSGWCLDDLLWRIIDRDEWCGRIKECVPLACLHEEDNILLCCSCFMFSKKCWMVQCEDF